MNDIDGYRPLSSVARTLLEIAAIMAAAAICFVLVGAFVLISAAMLRGYQPTMIQSAMQIGGALISVAAIIGLIMSENMKRLETR